MRILYDGWPVVYQPNNPAAMHMLAILAQLPDEIEPIAALPGSPPPWFPKIETKIRSTPDNAAARLQWEQRILPRLVAETGAQLLHLTTSNPPLFGPPVSVLSPASYDFDRGVYLKSKPKSGLVQRLRLALGKGGLSRTQAILWPSDLPKPDLPGSILTLPPTVHPDFSHKPGRNGGPDMARDLELPQTFILYHGPDRNTDLQRLLAAWSWAAGPLGEYYPLVVLGAAQPARDELLKLASNHDLEETFIFLPDVPPPVIAYIYRSCSALFHPAPLSPWGGPVRQALACGKPVVATESELTKSMVGPAAYLIPAEDSRQLGAALITSIVEEEVAESLSREALQQVDSWQSHTYKRELGMVYHNLFS